MNMRVIGYIILLAIIIFGMTFATLNSELVTINYYFGQSTLALSLLLVLAFAIGCLIGMIAGLWLLIKANIRYRRVKSKLVLAEKEIENLRAIPLQDKV
jgi:putative membrane protein